VQTASAEAALVCTAIEGALSVWPERADDDDALDDDARDSNGSAGVAEWQDERAAGIAAALTAVEMLRLLFQNLLSKAREALTRAQARQATSAQRRQLVLLFRTARAIRRLSALSLVATLDSAKQIACATPELSRALRRSGGPADRLTCAVQMLLSAVESDKGVEEQLRVSEDVLSLVAKLRDPPVPARVKARQGN
jgi:hypothetical protein